MDRIECHIVGVCPLLMHNGALADPQNEFTVAMKKLTSKKTNKSEKDDEDLSKFAFLGGLYLYEDKSPCIPGEVLTACIINAAKKVKAGTKFKPSVMVFGNFPLIYKGSRDIEELYEDGEHVDRRVVGIQNSKIVRVRPIFKQWELKFGVDYNPDYVNKSEIIDALTTAGAQIGIGDYRPMYGRFLVKSVK